jgi:Domain of unknown function (DUF5911)
MPLNIEDYAIIGDCETAALVGRDLSIDWLCWPRFDSSACFANLLGTKDNCRWSIEPADPGAKMTRNYRGHSLILETTIETTDGVAVVTDFMPTRMRGSHLIRRERHKGQRQISYRAYHALRLWLGRAMGAPLRRRKSASGRGARPLDFTRTPKSSPERPHPCWRIHGHRRGNDGFYIRPLA